MRFFVFAAIISVALTFTNLSVLGIKKESQTPSPIPKPNVASNPVKISPSSPLTPTPSPTPKYSKKLYKIAIFGDSMVDTMGEQLEYLQAELKPKYPTLILEYYNFGIGSQNISEGIARFHLPFSYQTRNYSPLPQVNPDIIILGSFSYNPFFPHDRQKHLNLLRNLVQEAKNVGADVYLLAEIAPLKKGFGKGPHGVNWKEEDANIHAEHIVEQLNDTVYLSGELKIPLINVFELSKLIGDFGNPRYVNPDDGIHPSVEGHQLMAKLTASTIKIR